MRKRLESLQTVRFIAFLGVFISHTSFAVFKKLGCFSVSVFFVLSGFLMMHNYYQSGRIKDVSFMRNVRFSAGKMKKLYPLHLVTAIMVFVPNFILYPVLRKQLGLELVFNTFLLHAWNPFCRNMLNYTSWFISCLAFDYFLFPTVLKRIENKERDINSGIRMLSALFVAQIFMGAVLAWVSPLVARSLRLEDVTAFRTWFIYNFPLSRLIDFLIGIDLYLIFFGRDKTIKKDRTIYEILSFAAAFLALVLSNRYADQWWSDVVVFTPFSCLIVYLFAIGQGKISEYRSSFITSISDLSGEGFLIHSVVFIYIESIVYRLIGMFQLSDVDSALAVDITRLTAGFLITVALSRLWRSCGFFK